MFWRSLIASLLPGVLVPHTELAAFDPCNSIWMITLNALTAHGAPEVCPNIYWHKLQTECLPDLVVSLPTMYFFWSRPLFLILSYAKLPWWYGQGPKLMQLQSTCVALLQTKCQDKGLCHFSCCGGVPNVPKVKPFYDPKSNHCHGSASEDNGVYQTGF